MMQPEFAMLVDRVGRKSRWAADELEEQMSHWWPKFARLSYDVAKEVFTAAIGRRGYPDMEALLAQCYELEPRASRESGPPVEACAMCEPDGWMEYAAAVEKDGQGRRWYFGGLAGMVTNVYACPCMCTAGQRLAARHDGGFWARGAALTHRKEAHAWLVTQAPQAAARKMPLHFHLLGLVKANRREIYPERFEDDGRRGTISRLRPLEGAVGVPGCR